MTRATATLGFIGLLAIPLSLGCSKSHQDPEPQVAQHENMWESVETAIATVRPTEGSQASGTVVFTDVPGGVRVVADLEGLSPNQKHGMHIHERGDCSAPDAKSAGEHYSPQGHHPHALPTEQARHAGDLGNVQADENGKAHLELTVSNISIAGLRSPIVGRSVIVHEKADTGAQPSGDAGGRIGCGVIGVAGGEQK